MRAILSIVSIVRSVVAFTPSQEFGLLEEGEGPQGNEVFSRLMLAVPAGGVHIWTPVGLRWRRSGGRETVSL